MKYLLFIPFAVLLGLAAGSWAPRQELSQLRNEVNKLEQKMKSTGKGGKLSALNSIIKIPEKKSGRLSGNTTKNGNRKTATDHASAGLSGTTNAVTENALTNKNDEARRRGRHRFPDPQSEDFDRELEEAKELWQTRVEIARSQWLARLNLDQEGEMLFDEAIAAMNEEIYLTMEIVADGLKNQNEMTTEAGLRVVNQVTDTLVGTYDGLREIVPNEKHRELEKMEMPDFIDPAAFDPLVDVRDKL
ncbi:MAG: hypothetical protein R6V06_09875 [Kiritimatiellia bacterium]